MKKFTTAAILSLLFAGSGEANQIRNACMASDRDAANRALCGCIQDVADLTLTRQDQSVAAGFFREPHRAQEIRQSSRRSHEIFWERYKNFGETAKAFCN